MIERLRALVLRASSLDELRALMREADEGPLMDELERVCGVAQDLLIRGIAAAREHGFDASRVDRHVTGPQKSLALLACQEGADGNAAMLEAIRTVLRPRCDEGTLI
jgi:hypothetical protein